MSPRAAAARLSSPDLQSALGSGDFNAALPVLREAGYPLMLLVRSLYQA